MYNADDLNGYEFKILRGYFPSFNKPEALRKALTEEAQNGWELLEKFDNNRIRLKRHKPNTIDAMIGTGLDPYRSRRTDWRDPEARKTRLWIILAIVGPIVFALLLTVTILLVVFAAV